jgi:hypothetical protein
MRDCSSENQSLAVGKLGMLSITLPILKSKVVKKQNETWIFPVVTKLRCHRLVTPHRLDNLVFKSDYEF